MENEKATAKAEVTFLSAQPSYPNVQQLTELLVSDINEAVGDLKRYVEGLEIDIPDDLKAILEKLEEFQSSVSGLTKQVAELKNLKMDLPAGLLALPKQVSSINAYLSKLKVVDIIPSLLKKVTEALDRLTGSLVESFKQKTLKKFAYINEHGKTFLMTEEEIKKQKEIEQLVKADVAKAEIKQDAEQKGTKKRSQIVMCSQEERIKKRLDNLHKTKEELELDFSIPLGEQDPLIKLNELAKKKRKHVDDLHDYFRSTKRSSSDFTKGLELDLARNFSTFLVAEVEKRNLNPSKQIRLIEQLKQ
ncbi:hypothetical protein Tco_1017437 [Tanacetum coccineum]|uniref:Uncharacterized protein n=1 Tax=Tanacetum coccineum TaxID=301880 RepID=A0ABQ5FRG8_9ASTR